MTTTDKRYPLCSAMGILRNTGRALTVSTTAMHDKLGWRTYQKFLPVMWHEFQHVTPESAEEFLQSLNGKRVTR